MKVFESFDMAYYNTTDQNAIEQLYSHWPANMTKMKLMIETRPRYPSNKLTFNIADIAKGTTISFININIDSNATYDVDLFLEDSRRNFLNSFYFRFVLSIMNIILRVQIINNLSVLLRECSTIT